MYESFLSLAEWETFRRKIANALRSDPHASKDRDRAGDGPVITPPPGHRVTPSAGLKHVSMSTTHAHDHASFGLGAGGDGIHFHEHTHYGDRDHDHHK